MRLTRRSMLGACAVTVPALGASRAEPFGGAGSLGVVIHSFPVRGAGDRDRKSQDRFSEPARFLDYAHSLGARGIQVSLGALDDTAAGVLRERASAASMYLEGIVSLPRDQADLGRFEGEIRVTKRAGAEVVRTVMLSGRRYETFATLAAFRRFAETSAYALSLAAPIVAHDIRLAVENHKDFRADELLALLKRVGNDHVGVCLDTGNSIALLEDPMEVVETLAPRAFTTHFKDMGLEEYPQGFLLAEVPFGAGILDLPRVVRVVRAAQPDIRLNLEMITRDPLKVPCLTEGYWVTFPDLPGRHAAHALSLIPRHKASEHLPRTSTLPRDEQLRAEDDNVRRCLAFARDQLGQ